MDEKNPDLISLDNLSKPTLIAMVMHYRKKESQNKEILGLTPRQLSGHSDPSPPLVSSSPVVCERCKKDIPHREGSTNKKLPRESSSSPSKKDSLRGIKLLQSESHGGLERSTERKGSRKKDMAYAAPEPLGPPRSFTDAPYAFGACASGRWSEALQGSLAKIESVKLEAIADEEVINCTRKHENFNILATLEDDESPMFRHKVHKTEKHSSKMLEEIGAFADSIGKACAQGKEYCAQWNAAIATLESMRKTHFLGFSVGLQKNLSTLSTYMNEFYDAHHRMLSEFEEITKDMKSHATSTLRKIAVKSDSYHSDVALYDEVCTKYYKKVNHLKNQKKIHDELTQSNLKRKTSCEGLILLLNSIEMNEKLQFIGSLQNIAFNMSLCSRKCSTMSTESLALVADKLALMEPIVKTISRQLPSSDLIVNKCEAESKGYLFKAEQKHGRIVGWEKHYYSIAYGYFIQSALPAKGNKIVKTRWNLLTCGAIKINTASDRDFVFEVTLVVQAEDKRSFYETLVLQAESNESRAMWMSNIQKTVANLLESQGTETFPSQRKSTRLKVPHEVLQTLLAKNPTCVDCNEKDPQWASVNLCAMMCINCSGVHRSLGTDISKVRSLKLDLWDARTVKLFQLVSNQVVNTIFEHDLKIKTCSPQSTPTEREDFIVAKYKAKVFVNKLALSEKEVFQNLFDAVSTNNVAWMLEYLVYCTNINSATSEGLTLLHKAIEAGSHEAAQLLILNNADVNLPAPLSLIAPIHTAAYAKNPIAIAMLVNAGASIEQKNKDGDSAESILKNCNDELKSALLGFEPVGQDGIADDDISALPFAVKSDSKLEENKDFKKVPSLISVLKPTEDGSPKKETSKRRESNPRTVVPLLPIASLTSSARPEDTTAASSTAQSHSIFGDPTPNQASDLDAAMMGENNAAFHILQAFKRFGEEPPF